MVLVGILDGSRSHMETTNFTGPSWWMESGEFHGRATRASPDLFQINPASIKELR